MIYFQTSVQVALVFFYFTHFERLKFTSMQGKLTLVPVWLRPLPMRDLHFWLQPLTINPPRLVVYSQCTYTDCVQWCDTSSNPIATNTLLMLPVTRINTSGYSLFHYFIKSLWFFLSDSCYIFTSNTYTLTPYEGRVLSASIYIFYLLMKYHWSNNPIQW